MLTTIAKRANLSLPAVGALVALGCADYGYDSATYFPQTWEADYTKVSSCRKSPDHGGLYVEVWADPTSKDLVDDAVPTFPSSAVMVKLEFNDSACTDGTKCMAMRKTGEGAWEYQVLGGSGNIEKQGKLSECSGCHQAKCAEHDEVCTGATK
jgi:hypothetical protein